MLRYEEFCNESTSEERKNFSSLAGWKAFVLDSGFRYKLQKHKSIDSHNWIAFSDEESDAKGFFKTIAPYDFKDPNDPSNPDLAGSGYVVLNNNVNKLGEGDVVYDGVYFTAADPGVIKHIREDGWAIVNYEVSVGSGVAIPPEKLTVVSKG